MKAWEYHVIVIGQNKMRSIQDTLNEAGENGWELMAIWEGLLIFKRERK